MSEHATTTQDAARRRVIALLVGLTLVWGTAWPLFPLAVREVSVWTFRSVSLLGAGLVLLGLAAWRGHPLSIPRAHRATVVAAALVYLVVWNVASTYAAVLIPSGQAAVLGFTMPFWAALLAWLVLGQVPDRRTTLAIALGTTGVVLLILRGATQYAQAPIGFALGMLAALGWAVGTLLLKARPVPVPALVLTGWQLTVASVPVTVGAFLTAEGGWFVPSWGSMAVIVYVTLVPMALGNALWFAIVGLVPAHVAALGSVLVPVVAMLSGAAVRGEPLGPVQWLAMACSSAGVALILVRRHARDADD